MKAYVLNATISIELARWTDDWTADRDTFSMKNFRKISWYSAKLDFSKRTRLPRSIKPMTKPNRFLRFFGSAALSLILLVATTIPLVAQTRNFISDYAYARVYAKRKMTQVDADGNGRFEKAEDQRHWQAMQSSDANHDDVLTLAEIEASEISYLDSPGPNKLNVLYKKTPEEDLHLDIYYPAQYHPAKRASQPLPTVIYTHGGGWTVGTKQGITNGLFKQVYTQLLKNGFCVVAVNYRLFQKDGSVSIRDCVVDVKDAARFLAKNQQALGIDSQRFFVHGDSAGGQLAQMLLLSPPESLPGDPGLFDASYKMVAGVSWYGPCDFEKTELFNHDGRADFQDRFGPRILERDSPPSQRLRLYQEVSPVNYLSSSSAPLLMIQGDQDTTIPVHHAHYMKQRADTKGASVEVLWVKNAGHNFTEVGGTIQPNRNEIVQRTIAFLTSHAVPTTETKPITLESSSPNADASTKGKIKTASTTERLPDFSWETIPQYIHVRKAKAFTDQEIEFLASFPLITFEKTTGIDTFGSTEQGTIEAAKAVKQKNPAAKTLFYRNVFVHYEGYDFDKQLDRIEAPFLVNAKGEDELVRKRVKAYDLSNPQVVDWWVKTMADVCNHDAIDGLFLDGNIKVLSPYLERDLPAGKKEQVKQGYQRMLEETRQALAPEKLMLANILRARFDDGGLTYIDSFDGSYLEGFEHAVGGVRREDYISKGIHTVRQAAAQGKIIALTLSITPGSLSDDVDQQQATLKSVDEVSRDRLNYLIAMFLIMAERHSYLNIHDGYDVNVKSTGECASKLWLNEFPEYRRPLGPPKGPPIKKGYSYFREFDHARVLLDLESEKGVIEWR